VSEEEGREFLLAEHICPDCMEQKKLRTLTVLGPPRHLLFCEVCSRAFERVFRVVTEPPSHG
jgi:hypothetical protein